MKCLLLQLLVTGSAALGQPTKMRAWYLDQYVGSWSGLNFSEAYSVPKPQKGEVLINVKASSVNPIDYKILDPILHSAFPLKFPAVLGYEASGVVTALGAGTEGKFKIGDAVWGVFGNQHVGGYADYHSVPAELVTLKPASLTFEEAGSFPLVALTTYQAFKKANAVHPLKGKTVLVLGGTGGTGFVAVQLAKRAYATSRVVVTASAENAGWIKSLGADEVIDYHTKNWWDVIANGTVDFVYDTVGQADTAPRATHKLSTNGVFATIAHKGPSVGLDPNPPPDTVQIYHKMLIPAVEDLTALKKMVDDKVLSTKVEHVYALPELLQAWNESAAGHVTGKLAISTMATECSAHNSCSHMAGTCCPTKDHVMLDCCYQKELVV